MYLEASAMVLLELHRALEADRSRETRSAARRAAQVEALAPVVECSDRVGVVAFDDGASSGGEASPDLGRSQDLEPWTGAEQRQRRLVRPVQAQPKS